MVIFALIFLLSMVEPVFGENGVPGPIFQDGDSWWFSVVEKNNPTHAPFRINGTFKVHYKQGKARVFDQTNDREERREDHSRHFQELLGLHKQVVNLKFPMDVGLKWDNDYTHKLRPAARPALIQEHYTVLGLEEVTVQGGKFRAFKIYKYMTARKARHEATYFYAPDAKCIVKSFFLGIGPQMTREIELLKTNVTK